MIIFLEANLSYIESYDYFLIDTTLHFGILDLTYRLDTFRYLSSNNKRIEGKGEFCTDFQLVL